MKEKLGWLREKSVQSVKRSVTLIVPVLEEKGGKSGSTCINLIRAGRRPKMESFPQSGSCSSEVPEGHRII